jgi:hypothetical protein
MNVKEPRYTLYIPNQQVLEQLKVEVQPPPLKRQRCLTYDDIVRYKPLLVNTKLLIITSKMVTFGVQIREGRSALEERRMFTVKEHSSEKDFGEVKEENLDTLIQKIFLENGPKGNNSTT